MLLCLGLFLILGYPIPYLRLQTDHYTCYLYATEFQLVWRHSVEKQWWIEYYRQQDQQLLLYQTLLQTFGAGTPATGKIIEKIPRGFVGYQQQLMLPELNWVVSPNMQGSLQTNNGTVPLAQMLPAYSVVNIKWQRSPLAIFLLGRSCYE
ncbi:hypothetical protein A6A20_00595 [Volucribacter amazonae]|uniref:DUF1850 domain-containing protein n=1 Tax=Volucribacter amazonae TaxID=256731 RepID=A0A9X4PFB0_9PAST|nr:hypothetical protein [Volucribacter amazonae]